MAPKVRPAKRDDLPRVLAIARACGTAAQWSQQQYEKILASTATDAIVFLVVVMGNDLSGFMVGHAAAGDWEIENIAVDPSVQHTGLGSHLLGAFLDCIRQRASSVFLEVRESNAAARKLYKKLGFAEVGRRKTYYQSPPEDAILLKRSF
jgi:[ribosomal protein S18]-alanine N-acetyltransferase